MLCGGGETGQARSDDNDAHTAVLLMSLASAAGEAASMS
jgi:hypothetical protein